MEEKKLGAVEARFADLIWENAPLSSTALVKLCAKELDWKKSTTYTVLKKLCDRGIFQNADGAVTALVTREEFAAAQSERFVEETFAGSLPAFLAAFTSRKPLSAEEADEIRKLIDAYREGK
ncbi:MAG: BlaI/MecI/CopY family transcriptional regulator [Oscillospiraceae bacterium]|nr:BlaI/MecI/CopY family transcriptional regulator [Oscillospiraceae bacterium]